MPKVALAPRRLAVLVILTVLLIGARDAIAQPVSLSVTAQQLAAYLPAWDAMPSRFRSEIHLIETANEDLVAAPGYADLAVVVLASRRITGVGFTVREREGASSLTVSVSAFAGPEGARIYLRDFVFPYTLGQIEAIDLGSQIGEEARLYRYSRGSGAGATDVQHLVFRRDRLYVEAILRAPSGMAPDGMVAGIARVVDAQVRARPPSAPTMGDLTLIEEPTPTVVVRGAVRLLLRYFVEELDPATLFTEAWQAAARALRRAGVANVPPSPAYPSNEAAAVALHRQSFPTLERLAQGRIGAREFAQAINAELMAMRNDCHTVFRTAEQWQRDKSDATGGAQVQAGFTGEKRTSGSPWRIVRITPNSPAKHAGMRRGQVILAVNGRTVAGLTLNEARALIDVREGATNVFRVQNPSGRIEELTILLDRFVVPPLESEILAGNVGLVRLYRIEGGQSGARQVELVRRALEDFEAQGVTGWLLDLRDNPGGNAGTMSAMLDLFVRGGRTWGQLRRGEQPEFNLAGGSALPFQRPLVILVGPGSASAGEILPGVLQARGRAVIVGQRTAGCIGSFLIGTGLLDGSVLRVTNTEIVIGPDGARLHGVGVTPNVAAPPPSPDDDEAGRDPQIESALDVLAALTVSTEAVASAGSAAE
jgi:carboxyl-terminal processing protease